MKKMSLLLAAVMAVSMLSGCNGDNSSTSAESREQGAVIKNPAEKTAELLTAVEHPEMVEVSSDKLEVYYGISADAVNEYSAYVCGSGAMPDEFGVFVATDSDKAEEIGTALEQRIEKQRATYADYTPAEMYKFDDSFVAVQGELVYYAVCADNTSAKDILG